MGRNEELDGHVIPGRHVRCVQACLARGRGVCAGVYPALAAGGDNIWGNGVLPTGDVTIVGGEVSEVDRRHGYLLEEQEPVVRIIVGQTEALCKDWAL